MLNRNKTLVAKDGKGQPCWERDLDVSIVSVPDIGLPLLTLMVQTTCRLWMSGALLWRSTPKALSKLCLAPQLLLHCSALSHNVLWARALERLWMSYG
jgi:hypothetical protein